MSDRAPDRVYILTERQFLESVVAGASARKYLPPAALSEVQRCAVERADNGGVVLRIWVGGERTVALEPQVLQPMLRDYAKELPGPVPTLAEVKAWPEADLLQVSQWVRALHARANPISGMLLPEVGDQPEILFEPREEPAPIPGFTRKPSAAKKKRKRVEKGSLADAHAAAARARERTEEDEPDPRERPGNGP